MSETHNRAFMYGESVFTTVRMFDGVLQDWEYHFDRLRKGTEFLYGPFTDADEWVGIFKNMLETRMLMENGDRVLRITVYREQQGRGLIRSGLISVTDLKLHLSSTHFDKVRTDGVFKLRTCPAIMRPRWWPSFLKAGNYLETILAQKIYLKDIDDDLLFLAPDDTILESSVANIFVVRRGKLYTPPAGPNVLEGVMRRKVLDVSKEFFEETEEVASNIDQVLKADLIFGTNSVRGLFLVDHIDGNELKYTQEMLAKFEMLKVRVLR
ncbi:aminotransferase class IV [Peredibacter starrii]|uniref:branched-chain-amino-acid transaminase n=1 Tax=Peredibacter starrii TaxID=28202 RepID=A0AAX4HN60_9BACT|nr:aminotransferase class IV [Peredibacter starrii]WPU64620.1 aminotransferase class IV [Peredibacter starrii]